MGPANNGKRAKDPPLMKRQKPDIRFVRTPLMGKDVPIGGIKLCTVYAFPVLRDSSACSSSWTSAAHMPFMSSRQLST